MERFRSAMRVVAGVFLGEGLFIAGWGLWAIAQSVWLTEIASLLEVSSPVWAAAVAGQVSLTVVVPALALAWLGWRWFRSPPRFTLSCRVALYLLLGTHVLASALAAVVPALLIAVPGSIGVVAAVVALALGIRTRASGALLAQQPAPPVRWMRGVTLAATLVAVTTGTAAAVAAVRPSEDWLAMSYDDELVVCRGAVDDRCAEEAARRSEFPVAWLPDDGTRESHVFVVHRRASTPMPLRPGAVFQEGRANWVRFTLSTNPGPPEGGPVTDTVTIDDTAVDVRVDADNASFAYLDWVHAGVAYRLVAFRTSADEIDSVVAEAKRMVADVRYG